jgi:hypothetical protein
VIRAQKSPALGWILVHNEAAPPGLGRALPAFHVDELRLLKRAKVEEWQAVGLVKAVFPGAVVTEYVDYKRNRKRFEQRMKRASKGAWRAWSGSGGGPRLPEPDPDDD